MSYGHLDWTAFQKCNVTCKNQPFLLYFFGGGRGILKTVRQRLMAPVKYGECGWSDECRIHRHFGTTWYCKLLGGAKLHVVSKQMEFCSRPSSRQVLPTYLHPAVLKHIMLHLLSSQHGQTLSAQSNTCKEKKCAFRCSRWLLKCV